MLFDIQLRKLSKPSYTFSYISDDFPKNHSCKVVIRTQLCLLVYKPHQVILVSTMNQCITMDYIILYVSFGML